MKRPDVEIAILGGGTAGSAAALSLRQAGVDGVVVIEPGRRERTRVGESIPPDTQLVLRRLGVWEGFLADGHDPCVGSCSAWGDEELGFNDFIFNPHGNGWHLDRPKFDDFLARRAVEAGAEVRLGTRFRSVQRLGTMDYELRLVSGHGTPETLHARVVVDATGHACLFARMMGARRLRHDRLTCVTGFLSRLESVFTQLTMLEAVDYGWWYAARVPDGRIAVAVASDPDIVRGASLQSREEWHTCLMGTRHLADELVGCPVGATMETRSAQSAVLDRVCGTDWLAVGDAACSYDPLSARGIRAALDDGERAGHLVAARLGGDISAFEEHQAAVAARFEDYLVNLNYLYSLERRWPSSPFWSRRKTRTAAR